MSVRFVASLAAARTEHHHLRVVGAARRKTDAIAAFYRAVDAPAYAASNLDALADIMRDLAWLPGGHVRLAWLGSERLPDPDRAAILDVLRAVAEESAGGLHPLTVYVVES